MYGNLEVWSQPLSLNDCGNDELRFLGFYDIGSAWAHTAITGIPSNTDMQSVGVGMRYNYTRYLQARLDYGYRMKTPVGLPQPKSRVHLGVVVSY